MSEADVELMREGFAAFAAEGPEGLIRFIHPDFEMTTPAALAAEPDTYCGHDGLRRYFESFYDAMDDIRFELVDIEDLGEGRVMIPTVLRARGLTTGIEVEQELVQVWEVRDGLGRRCHVVATREKARRAFS